MTQNVLFPAVITGDLHVHSRNGRSRIRELSALIPKIQGVRQQQQAKSLIILGDLLDHNAPLPIDVVLMLARLFLEFEQVWIVVGNHDTPLRSTALTALDLFSLCGAQIIKQATQIGDCLFLPYYARLPEQYKHRVNWVFGHKDILNLNGHADQEWAISLAELPPCRMFFNGHLHVCQAFGLMSGGTYVQAGAPYPCTWGEDWQQNRYIHVLDASGNHTSFYTHVTGDKGAAEGVCDIIRDRETPGGSDSDADTAMSQIFENLQSIKEDRASLSQVMEVAQIDKSVAPIIKSVVNRAVAKIESVRI